MTYHQVTPPEEDAMTDPTTSTTHSTAGLYVHAGEEYTRDTTYIEDRIVTEPDSAELAPGARAWPVEAGRYRLVAARACPWA
ncbi:hypothetical protein LAN16_21935, partial [Mycobacterium tuberculosis]|nr:hypothetical protein [Mycobacterium tuberculosis]